MRRVPSYGTPYVSTGRRLGTLVPAALVLVSLGAAATLDPRTMGGIKGDEATYVGMAASLGHDGDFTFSAADYQRFRGWFSQGPEGIFLKQDDVGALHFGKAYVYGILAAPFSLAGRRGLFAFNLICLGMTIAGGFWWLARPDRRGAALLASVLFATAAITPLYAAWLTSDLLNYALVFMAFVVGWPRRGGPTVSTARMVAAVVILAAATFSKPLNVLLAAPLVMGAGDHWRAGARSLVLFAALVAAMFTVNAVISGGDPNYQGGNRRTFYTHFPYDEDGHTFGTAGISRATNIDIDIPDASDGRWAAFPANLWYFLAGRHFGVIAFGWPWLCAVVAWAVGQRVKLWREWMLLLAVAATAVATILWMPYTWFGGGGPVGNRYFLSLAAALFFLWPPSASARWAVVLAGGLVFVTPSLVQPFTVAGQPWRASRSAPFQLLPLELTGASDFPVILDRTRGGVPQGQRPPLFIAFLDDIPTVARSGWIVVPRPARTEMLARSPEPIDSMTMGLKSETACEICVDAADEVRLAVAAGERRDIDVPVKTTFSLVSYAFAVTMDTTRCTGTVEVAMQATRRTATAP